MVWLTILVLIHCSSAFAMNFYSNASCITPSGNHGRCIPTSECPFIKTQIPNITTFQDYQYVMSFQCGPNIRKPHVCCPKFNNAEDCGTIGFTDRIVGGEETELGEFPWMALLGYQLRAKQMFRCGGSLINDRFVLTAAHCVANHDPWKLDFVRLGEWDLDTSPDCDYDYFGELQCNEVHQDIGISKVMVHGKFSKGDVKMGNDIALLKLDRRVVSTESIESICIPNQKLAASLNIQRIKLFVSGWGATETEANSKRKLATIVKGQSMGKCSKAYRKRANFFTESQLCAGGERGRDSCRGDSGGPLMAIVQNRWHLLGIVSFGSGLCGLEGMPAIYTRVGSFLDWLAGKIELENRNEIEF